MSEATTIVTGPDLLDQYGCGPIRFSGTNDALYERHLLFDDIIAPTAAGAREQFEAAARSGRDVLSQRWVLTESTYDSLNPKRIYYLSMEFLIGRSWTNNVTNLLLNSFVERAVAQKNLDWLSHRTRTRCWSRKRRAGAPRGLLSGFDGDYAVAGDGLWAALRIRHVQAIHRRRVATRTAR